MWCEKGFSYQRCLRRDGRGQVLEEAIELPGTDRVLQLPKGFGFYLANALARYLEDPRFNAFAALDDCNHNGLSDLQEIADGTVEDCTDNTVPDECEPDCSANGSADSCDIAAGESDDCTGNYIPDECEPDCNENGVADSCDIAAGTLPVKSYSHSTHRPRSRRR